MKICVRKAHRSDAATLTAIAIASKQSNGYDQDFMAACRDELRVTEPMLDMHEYWVAEGQQVCGFVCLKALSDGATGTVSSFFIAPQWQRRGIGKLLWTALLGSAKEKGLVKLRLDSDPEAEPFYKGLGFTTVGHAPSGSIPGRMLPHMEMQLFSQ